MPVITQCPKCGKKLKAPEDKVGQKAKCPQCGKPFLIQPVTAGTGHKPAAAVAAKVPAPRPSVAKPAPAQPRAQPIQEVAPADTWYVQTADGAEYGPVTRAELDQWVVEERLDAECQILQEGWDQWKWAEEVLPQLAGSGQASTAANPFAGISDTAPGVVADSGQRDAGSTNPFASPTDALGAAEPSAVVSAKIVRSMEGTRPWVQFFSILAFIASGLYALFAMLSLAGIRQSVVGTLMMFLIIGAYASIFGFVGYLLLTYSKEAGAFVRSRNVAALEKALESQRSFWKTVGILAIVLIAITILMVIASFLFVGVIAAMAGTAAD